MLEKKLNKNSIDFLQKVLLFIDSVIINAVSSNPKETDRILTNGLLNIKEAIRSEISYDIFVGSLNKDKDLTQEKNKKKEQNDPDQERLAKSQ